MKIYLEKEIDLRETQAKLNKLLPGGIKIKRMAYAE